MSIEAILKSMGTAGDIIAHEMECINSGEYVMPMDICNRSRELAKLYIKAKEPEKAIEILNVMLEFCFKTTDIVNRAEYIYNDVNYLITIYSKKTDKDKIIKLLNTVIKQYPNSSRIYEWQKELDKYMGVKKEYYDEPFIL